MVVAMMMQPVSDMGWCGRRSEEWGSLDWGNGLESPFYVGDAP